MSEVYVYILKSLTHDKTYVGQTENLERRLREHNSGKSNYTSKFVPWKIVFTRDSNPEKKIRKRKVL